MRSAGSKMTQRASRLRAAATARAPNRLQATRNTEAPAGAILLAAGPQRTSCLCAAATARVPNRLQATGNTDQHSSANWQLGCCFCMDAPRLQWLRRTRGPLQLQGPPPIEAADAAVGGPSWGNSLHLSLDIGFFTTAKKVDSAFIGVLTTRMKRRQGLALQRQLAVPTTAVAASARPRPWRRRGGLSC